ncbi:CDP-glycerol glycerophosphotransferase family protein [Enterococcus sp. CWB-B31]|uniref:CDP-glycerol glycerophosphotransferase family protein n=1 Tax=Enterococcus sp. CWB-B31 TaxID=2885159 RepID=UPI001E4F2693|nr:CDP-glycerol glycerophosphotransferase family protein [Enterococcus sp. CWB-B31]MCB5953569.1 CDP-glycerol glycerophosphotransferase family protein [Enterococcus sp. CWB-B31]
MKLLKLFRKAKTFSFKILYMCFSIIPINKKRITFASDSRATLSGNLEYLYTEINRRNKQFSSVFFLKASINDKKTLFYLIKFAWSLARSRYILIDDFFPLIYQLKIRKETDLIQVWHAAGAFKKFGYSRMGLPGGPSPKSKNHKNYTKVFVSSSNVIEQYAEGFGVSPSTILPLGLPRTDLFFDLKKMSKIETYLKTKLPFIINKKIILFAPTFRGNGQLSAYYPNDWLDYEKLYETYANSNYICLIKFHPFIKEYTISDKYKDFFFDVSEFREINDLLIIADVLVTDYSSVIFEYALLKKKIIFFTPDLDEYIEKRGFYFDFKQFVPGPVAYSSDELIHLLDEQIKADIPKIEKFIEYSFDYLDGRSSERIIDYLIEIQ